MKHSFPTAPTFGLSCLFSHQSNCSHACFPYLTVLQQLQQRTKWKIEFDSPTTFLMEKVSRIFVVLSKTILFYSDGSNQKETDGTFRIQVLKLGLKRQWTLASSLTNSLLLWPWTKFRETIFMLLKFGTEYKFEKENWWQILPSAHLLASILNIQY